MKSVLLRYPRDFSDIQNEARILTFFGFITQTSFRENTIHVSVLANNLSLEEAFTDNVIATLQKYGVEVEIE